MQGSTPGAEGLHLLATLLEQFVEGQYDLWQQVAGRREMLRAALRQAVQQARTHRVTSSRTLRQALSAVRSVPRTTQR